MIRLKRTISLVLCCAMLAGYVPAPAYAEDISRQGLCEHHPEHIDCSYTAAVEAAECGHQHEDACYTMTCIHVHGDCGYIPAVEGVACDHQHDEVCGYAAAVAEVPCSCVPEVKTELTHAAECAYDPSVVEITCTCTPAETVLETIHAEDCTYAPAVPESECNHVHGECSYVEASDAVPCDHDCTMDAVCNEKVLNCLHEHNEECGHAEARAAVACDFACEECANAAIDVASAEEHRYGTVYTPYVHTNDAAKPYSLIDGIYYSTNHSRDSEASYTIEANFDTTISFNYGVSSETNSDEFTLTHNGTQLFCISGLKSGMMTVDLAQGDTLVFTYEKDGSESDGDDRGWFGITSGDNYLNEELTTANCRGDVCCLDCGEILYEQLPHSIITVPGVDSTCTTEGKTVGQACSKCGFVTVAQDPIPMVAHSFVNGICTICESEIYSEGITFQLSDNGTFYIVSGIGTFTGESLIIPQSYNRLPVKEIGASAFANCSALTSVTIPSSITAIADKAFHNCSGLRGVYISDLDAWCDISFDYEREWDEGIWVESYSNPLKYAHNLYLNGEQVTDIVLTDAPKSFAFYGCNLNSVTFTRQVGLNRGVFRGSSLRDLYIPGGPSYLGEYSLYNCSNITGAFYLPASVTEVGDWTFWGPNIKIMYLEGSKIPNRCDDLDYGNTGPFSGSGAKVVYSCQLVQVDGLDYIIKDGEAWFIRCPQTRVGSVEIIPQVTYGDQTYNVTKIGDYAFYKCDQITSITIPDSITHIGQSVFSGTDCLNRINISDIASWCNIAFAYTSSNPLYYNCDLYLDGELVTDIIIPDSVTSINDYVFYGCDSLTSITMGSGVTSIGYHAFSYCSALSSVILGSGLNSIGVYAFSNCAGLTNIVIPNTVTIIDSRAFEDCTGLSSITISGSVTNVGYGVFGGCISLKNIRFESDAPTFNQSSFDGLTATVEYPANNLTWTADVMKNYGGTITWVPYTPEHTHEYGNDHKCECGAIGGTCGDNLIWMLDDAGTLTISGTGAMPDYSDGSQAPWYSNAKTVKRVVVEEGITSLSNCGFENPANLGFVNLTEVVLPDSLQSIGSECFQYCRNLTEIQIPEQVTSIGIFAFEYCQGLESIVIPSGVTVISQGAFNHCDSLKSVTIPAATKTIAYGAFDGCTAITDVYYGSSEKDWNSISVGSYNDCLLNATIHYTGPCAEGHTEVVDEAVDATCIEDGLTEGRHCSVCGTVTIPQKVISAGGSHSFVGSACEYCGVPGGMCGDTAIWTFDENTKELTISGTGNMYDYDSGGKKAPWHVYRDQIKALDIGTGVTYIGEDAFYECYGLSSVTVPNSVKKIGSGAFIECSSLTAITLPDQLESIKDYTFSQCSVLSDVTIPATVKTIGIQAFNSCLLLKDITIPAAVTSVGDFAFYNCRNLQTMTFLGKAPQISDSAFTDVENLTAYYPANDTSWATVITKQYGGKVTWVAVGAPTLANIRISAPPVKRLYIQNKDALDVTGGKLILTYSDRSTEVIDMTADMVTGFDNTKLGSQKLTVTYGGFTVYLTVTVRVDIDATSGTWGNLNWNIDESGTLTISGTGEMVHFMDGWEDLSVPPIDGYLWHRHKDSITSIVVKEGVTSLAEIAFIGLKNLTSVTLPDSLVTIDEGAFAFCTSLESITMPANVATIGKYIFMGSTSFKEITFVGNAPSFDAAAFEEITATAIYPAANKSWTEDVLKDYGGHVTWVPYGLVNNRLVLDLSELGDQTTVWIDGIACDVHISGNMGYVDIPHDDAKTMVIYTYHVGDANDVHTQYPISMKVWALEKQEDGSYKANRVEALDDILQYSGSSIRITGNKGIRMITSVPQEKKNAMVSGDLAGYKLLEYGTVLAQVSKMADGPLVLGPEYAKSNYAYKRGVADPVFAYAGDLVQYTNVLVGFTNDQCKEDIAMRPYMILENEKGEQVTLYGGIVYRSIGYIAYQNRSVFAVGSAAYNYVWEIIHHVYGDKYDAEYKG